MTSFLWFVTDFGDSAVTVPLAAAVLGLLAAAGRRRLALRWALAILGCAAVTALLKMLLAVCGGPRTADSLVSPSGHTAISIAVYGGLAAIVGREVGRPVRGGLNAAAAVLVIAIAVSRRLLHQHSPSEVAVGLAVGAAALAALLVRPPRERPGPLPLGWLAGTALIILVLFHGVHWPAEQAIDRIAGWLWPLRTLCG